jgi:thiamine pyrophosphokinase
VRSLVILSGEIRDDDAARTMLARSDRVVCADGGAKHLHRLNFRPDLLVGDLDSISPVDRAWLDNLAVPVREYPAVKDETDAELAILAAMEDLPEPRGQHELIVLAALGSRPDHVLANQLLAARLAIQGWQLILTDGESMIYTLTGGQTLTLDLPVDQANPMAVSAIPVTGLVAGLTYSGLTYPLNDATLEFGSTRGVSNRVKKCPVTIQLQSGVLLIVVTPEV